LPPGQVSCVVWGKTAAGKSTLVKDDYGFGQTRTSGTMQISGTSFAPQEPRAAPRRAVGMVFSSIFPYLTR